MKIALAFVAALALAGCGKKKEEAPAPPAPPPTTAGSGSSAMAGSAGSAGLVAVLAVPEPVDVPTLADFESKVKDDITNKNVGAKVQTLEQELDN